MGRSERRHPFNFIMIDADILRLSPNFHNVPILGRTVIIHATRSGVSMNPTEFEGTLNWFQITANQNPNAGASSHWLIARDGRAARVVKDTHQAQHAQEDNDNAWGIELEQGIEEDGFTEAQINKLVEVCRGYVQDFGVSPIHVRSSAESGFAGHQETAQGRRNGKSDPGAFFPWDSFIARLQPEPGVHIESITETAEYFEIRFTGTGSLTVRGGDVWREDKAGAAGSISYTITPP